MSNSLYDARHLVYEYLRNKEIIITIAEVQVHLQLRKEICFYHCGVANFSTFLPTARQMLLFPHTHIPDTTSSVYRVSRRQPFHLARVSPVFSVNDGQTLIRHLPADNAKRIVKRAVSSLSLMKLPES